MGLFPNGVLTPKPRAETQIYNNNDAVKQSRYHIEQPQSLSCIRELIVGTNHHYHGKA